MSFERLAGCLLNRQPYFGSAYAALQGWPERHQYMLPIARLIAERRPGPIAILEIGSWAGGSAITWARALQNLGCGGRVTCVDFWRPYFDQAKENQAVYRRMDAAARSGVIRKLFFHNIRSAGVEHLVDVRGGDSADVLWEFANGAFDVVYIDGAHLFNDVFRDLGHAMRLVNGPGIVCGDDLELLSTQVDESAHKAALAAGLDFVYSETCSQAYHPGVTEAVARQFAEVSAWEGFWATSRGPQGWCGVSPDLNELEIPAHIVAAVEAEHREIIGRTASHTLVQSAGRFIAIADELTDANPFAELLGERELPPYLFLGNDAEEVRQKASGYVRPARVGLSASQTAPAVVPNSSAMLARVRDVVQRRDAPTFFEQRFLDALEDPAYDPACAPDFLVIGAPRAASSWVSANLGAHPNVYMPPEKELKFFSSNYMRFDLKWYLQMFQPGVGKRKGEVSPSYYLLPSNRVRLVHSINPDVKVIYTLREPVSRIWSDARHYFKYVLGQRPDEVSPQELERYAFGDGPILASQYLKHLKRWADIIGPNQINVVFMEDINRHPGRVFRKLCDFLGLPDSRSPLLHERLNVGEAMDIPVGLLEKLQAVYSSRLEELDSYLRQNWGLRLPPNWRSVGSKPPSQPVLLLEDNAGGDLFTYRGNFLASAQPEGKNPYVTAADADKALSEGRLVPGTTPSAARYAAMAVAGLEERQLADLTNSEAHGEELLSVQSDYFGFNIVFFGECFFGLRQTLGQVDLRNMSLDEITAGVERGDVFVSDSVDVLRRLMAPRWVGREPGRLGEGRQTRTDMPGYHGELQIKLIDTTRDFNLVQAGNRYMALAKRLGPTAALVERLGERDLSPLILVAETRAEVRKRALECEDETSRRDPPTEKTELIGAYGSFNLVQVGQRYVGLDRGLGPTHLLNERLGERDLPPVLFVADSLEELKAVLPRQQPAAELPTALTGEVVSEPGSSPSMADEPQAIAFTTSARVDAAGSNGEVGH